MLGQGTVLYEHMTMSEHKLRSLKKNWIEHNRKGCLDLIDNFIQYPIRT